MQQSSQCFSVKQAQIRMSKTIQPSRIKVAVGHGEYAGIAAYPLLH